MTHEHSTSTRRTLDNPHEVLLTADLRQGKTLLDIGTGSGYLALAAAEIVGPRGKVYAVDSYAPSIEALRDALALQQVTNVEPLLADATRALPVPAHSIDVCLLANVLHGFVANGELTAVIANLSSALREEAEAVVIDFKKTETPYGPPLAIRLEPSEIQEFLAVLGFTLVKQFDAGPYHYALVFQRKGDGK